MTCSVCKLLVRPGQRYVVTNAQGGTLVVAHEQCLKNAANALPTSS